ncbi:hypothetical protein [Demequina globuliformis]|uniref:hypothetical protein n=1 Tax=Demequina globuliformis TaxID=676202 RepID=UPI000784F250|nr:hypothetical protein [Demequina globuliformis]
MTTHRTVSKPSDLQHSHEANAAGNTATLTSLPSTVTPLGTPEQLDAARRYIDNNARNPRDAAGLMGMLGIGGAK